MLRVNRVNKIQGIIAVPGDKSISHRSIMLASISKGETVIENFLRGEDCLSTIDCCRGLGIRIEEEGKKIIVYGNGLSGLKEPEDVLNVGNSGTTIRLLSGILAGQEFLTIITGDSSIRRRPMARIATPLREMGAIIEGRDNGRLAPLSIKGGGLKAIDYTLPVSSAQVKSAIMLAGLFANGNTKVTETTQSRDHTERMLKAFGGNVKKEDNTIIISKSDLYGQTVEVPGDISSAAFFMVAAAAMPGSNLTIQKVGLNPTRTGIIDVLKKMGADIEMENSFVSGGEEIGDIIIRGCKLVGTCIEKEIIPRLIDEIPVIAVAAALAEGKTTITGAEELKFKESNRITAMVTEMKKLGINITELTDGMEIEGPNIIGGGNVESYGDHRIAMAMAICGLFANDTVKISNSECISISFPQFEERLKEITL
ncbi:3-phosphoshikimate 1-carboxyvinyltransferase [Alkaliphilus peptidifermentans]|uniref:3-phosphoshikimate 1-carboxyvinyltransferase n=1 Tax=Alkaliphilus peptidifermentans DSM 18978 TaxID=1120976 RepID=A0A1G5DAX7_9FIRM|nr:3-phosphoshikimate 1-carboxyvinyltransferase [Alkaliphilus peptidifermentans]SCY11681.1 3-phosphoshikimate 1-carboxyvinyltransferase [Alkaliphilus peptidifermentans DSM 18978]